jgi:large subunit ribosomal protein L25
MLTLQAKIREKTGKKTVKLRKAGLIPAVLYGPSIKENLILEVNAKNFAKVFQESGESSLVKLEVEGAKKKEYLILVRGAQRNPLTLNIEHIDFYQPAPEKEIKVTVPLVFEGAPAAAIFKAGVTLLKNIQEVQILARPENLPHEIKVDVSHLDEIGKTVTVADLQLPSGVKILKNPEEIVAQALEAQKIEEELAKPIEEKVEEVKVVEKEKKEEPKEGELT